MDYTEHQLAILSAQKYNILPLTSICNMNCIFCSHKGNPPEVKTFSSGHRPLNEIKELISFLNKNKKIVIGESITRICEGEPFIHPQFRQVLIKLRNKFPRSLIKLTTNGSKLNEENINLLAKLKPIELNLSLNSATVYGRDKLMSDSKGEVVLKGIERLNQAGIIYHGSIVALPQIIGWSNLEKTIVFLEKNKARTIRVFLPGYTKFSPEEVKFDLKLWGELEDFIERMKEKYSVPLTLEPARIKDLSAVVGGIIKNSPADKSGMHTGDEIISINKKQVFSRVDAFNRLVEAVNPAVKVNREGVVKDIELSKEAGQKPGVVLDYDLALETLTRIKKCINSSRAEKILLFTSQLAEERFKVGLKAVGLKEKVKVLPVENYFFGGSIVSAGLLTAADFKRALENFRGELTEFDLVLLPEAAFDFRGYDLTGQHYRELEEKFVGTKLHFGC